MMMIAASKIPVVVSPKDAPYPEATRGERWYYVIRLVRSTFPFVEIP